MKTYQLPPKFYEDHRLRDLPEEGVSRVVRETKTHVFVEMDAPAFFDLLGDAEYYSNTSFFERELFGLCSSAMATARALREAGAPTEGDTT